jgi:pimeloyl-ACP methyl ester carboxylesterase
MSQDGEAIEAPNYLELADGSLLAYHHSPGVTPGILFCPGFNSDMQGNKALALDAWCRARGRQFTRFDYSGHGQSSGRLEEGTIGRWRDDTLAILDVLTSGPQLVVGSSMGGWIMLLVALARPQRITGLVGVAAAADFTESLRNGGLSAAQLQQLGTSGYCDLPNCYDDGEPYRIGRRLLEEGREHLLLDGEIAIDMPVRLIQGQCDPDVPWRHALTIAEKLRSTDVEVQLLKSGDHRLSEPADLARLLRTVEAILPRVS